jgi:hypothetical protein
MELKRFRRWDLVAIAFAIGVGGAGRPAAAQAPTGAISGVVADGGGSGIAGVVVTITDGTTTSQTTTDGLGRFSATGLAPGSYTATPVLAGRVLVPASRTATVIANRVALDFVATTPIFAVAGRVADANGSPIAGVTVALSGGSSATTTTDASGGYRFAGLAAGASVTVAPALAGFTFAPVDQTAVGLQHDVVLAPMVAASGLYRRYFAEGASNGFFSTRFALLNPGGTPTTAHLRFQTSTGQVVEHEVALAGMARVTVDPASVGAANTDFATVVESSQPLVADRTMRWDASGYGSHAETSLAQPLTTWYFAEGSTTGSFNLFYLLQNPGATPAQVEVRYLRPSPASPIVKTYTVAPASRRTIYVNQEDPALDETDVSAVITVANGVPIVAERAMYTNAAGQTFGAGHESAGIAAPASQWFLAEGATGPFFHQFILVANPTATPAPLEFRYLLTDGRVITKLHTVAPASRLTIGVHAEDPALANASMSTVVTSTRGVPVLVERAMWWPASGPEWYEAHDSAGATATGTKWAVADGEAGGASGADTFLLIANTALRPGAAAVTVVFEDGGTATRTFPLLPSSRFTVAVSGAFPEAVGRRFGAIVESVGEQPVPIVVERAMYDSPGGVVWAAGSNLLATRLQGPVEPAIIPLPSGSPGQAAPVTTAGVLGGDPEMPAIAAIPDVVAERGTPQAEITADADGRRVARTSIEIAFARTATVGQVNAVLDAIAGRIVDAIAGVPIVVVRIPDPGSLDALQAAIARTAALPSVRFVNAVRFAETAILPDTHIAPATGPLSSIDHLIAARAPAAWNARAAIDSPRAGRPLVIVTDKFGGSDPHAAIDASLVPLDFTISSPNPHGYHVLGIIAGTFASVPALAAEPDIVVGLFPGTSIVRVFDLAPNPEGEPNLPAYANFVMRLVRDTPGGVVVNTSLQYKPVLSTAQVLPLARAWIEKVRTSGVNGTSLETRFVHAHAAGNSSGAPATLASEPGAAALLPNLTDEEGNPLAHLSNTLVVENRLNTPAKPFEPGCLSNSSNRDGNIGAVGENVFSLLDRGFAAGNLSGTSMSSPLVAALAEYVWTLDPTLPAQGVLGKIRTTARPGVPMTGPGCLNLTVASAPAIDAYAAVLAVDRGLASPLVRATLLDVTGAAGGDVADGVFDEHDLDRFAGELATRNGVQFDFSRFDLNGDGRTGGETTERFDLDASTPAAWTSVSETIEANSVTFDETRLTDLQILCYYAYSPLYAGDTATRAALLPACHSVEAMASEADIHTTISLTNPLTGSDGFRIDDDASSSEGPLVAPFIGRTLGGVFDPAQPGGPNPSTYRLAATGSMPTPPSPDSMPASGTFAGQALCSATGAGIDDGSGNTTLPLLPQLSASTGGSIDMSTRIDRQTESPSITVSVSGALSRGAGSGEISSGVGITGSVAIDVFSGGVQQPRVSFSLRNYESPSDNLPTQEPVAHTVTVNAPGFVEISWNLRVSCASRSRAAIEGASGGVQLSYTVTR